jgi:alpha-glucosidase
MSLANTPRFRITENVGARITLQSEEGHVAHFFVLEEDMVRVVVLPGGAIRFPRSWAITPGQEDGPVEGRDRFDLSGFASPPYQLEQSADTLRIATSRIRLSVQWQGLYCQWELFQNGVWHLAAADRATQNYNFGWWDHRVYHYLKRESDEMYFGLGERAGTTNRAGQSYRLTNLDAMGYNARTTDPLYKHIPYYLTWKSKTKIAYGIFYDTLADCTFDLGRELDNYHGHYRYFVADYGDLDYYFIGGLTVEEVVRRYTWLTGRPAFTPKWGLGYSGSTMAYTDAPDAQKRMDEFLGRCQEHDILCDSFHLSSGYTSIEGKRYVFNWDRSKFPDPEGFVRHYLVHGVRLCPNIKPCLLRDHPRFKEAEAEGLFIHDEDGKPTMVQFWDEVGAYLDFTNPKTIAWWKGQVTESLLKYGIAATWNDNNEFEIWTQAARSNGFGDPRPAVEAKPLQTLLMMRASRDAQHEFAPQKRPFLVTRSGAAGMQRYVQTWSGDNYTSWETLRYNIKMGIGLALSGVSNLGHDIGGFSGPAPGPELFLRWIQFGIFLPRFSIHSWNDDETANEPWMYPEITTYVRDLIKFRYRLVPYFYDLLWRAHHLYEPIIRPTFHDFPQDENCYLENDEMLLGKNLLVAAVVEPGHRARRVYLPAGSDWYDFWTGDHYAGGQTIELPAPWDRPPLLARAGGAIPLNVAEQHFAKPADERAFCLFPHPQEGEFQAECFEDDGETDAYREGKYWTWKLQVSATASELGIKVERQGVAKPSGGQTVFYLPHQELRRLHLQGGSVMSDTSRGTHREVRIALD